MFSQPLYFALILNSAQCFMPGTSLRLRKDNGALFVFPEITNAVGQVDVAVIQSQISDGAMLGLSQQIVDASLPIVNFPMFVGLSGGAVGAAIGLGGKNINAEDAKRKAIRREARKDEQIALKGERNKELELDLDAKKLQIKELKKGLVESKSKSLVEREELINKVSDLEEELFQMDNEFESQTGEIKKQFEDTLQRKLDEVKQKTTTDLKFSLDIQLMEERSLMLQERFEFINNMEIGKAVELADLRMQQTELKEANKQLKLSLSRSTDDIVKLRAMLNEKGGLWPLNVMESRGRMFDAEKEKEAFESSLVETESALNNANLALDEANAALEEANMELALLKDKKEGFKNYISKES